MRKVESVGRFYGCYRSEKSATLALCRMVGQTLVVDFPGITDRFDACVVVQPRMLGITRLNGGWGVSFTYTPDDLIVKIRDEDGTVKKVPYPTVAHWQDATTPPVEA